VSRGAAEKNVISPHWPRSIKKIVDLDFEIHNMRAPMLNATYIQAIARPEIGGDLHARASQSPAAQSGALESFAGNMPSNRKGGITFS
jgi:hypothetical protein